jgi:hypothetical protein
MEPGYLPRPNAKKIDELFKAIKSGENDDVLSACESFIVEDEFFQWEGTPQIRKQREANKEYFREKGGIQIMLELIKNAADDLVKRFGIDVLWAYSELTKTAVSCCTVEFCLLCANASRLITLKCKKALLEHYGNF